MSQSPPPPPPPGGYGSPPPAGGYGYGGPAGTPPYSVGNAVSYGWQKFQANAGQIIIAGVVIFVAVAAFQVVSLIVRGAIIDYDSGIFLQLFVSALSFFLYYVVQQIISAGVIRGSLGITQGRAFEFTEVFKTDKIGPVIVTSLISGAIVFVGFILCILPGIVASFMLYYALYFVIDRDMEPIDAIKASFDLVKNNVGEALLWAIVAFALTIAGAIACGVGLIVAIPVTIIGTAYTFKKLTGQEVAP